MTGHVAALDRHDAGLAGREITAGSASFEAGTVREAEIAVTESPPETILPPRPRWLTTEPGVGYRLRDE